MEPAAVTAPVIRERPLPLPADRSAVYIARVKGRTLLTVMGWPGSQHAAVDVLYVLVNNAVQHGLTTGETGQSLDAWLRITEAHELLIDVTDPKPTFPDFDRAVGGELGWGLWGAKQLGATITWFRDDSQGKTVRAVMQPGQVDL